MKILFICTHNRCRSILAEAITNHIAGEKISARSAVSSPVDAVHPLSLNFLAEAGIDTNGLKSQAIDEQQNFNPDVVITVCDNAAGEACPLWLGKAVKIHWGLKDPSALANSNYSDEEVKQAFLNTINIIKQRINKLLEADLSTPLSTETTELLQNLASEGK
jgi:arsenate reductase